MTGIRFTVELAVAAALCTACAQETHTTECPEPPSYDVRFIEVQFEDGQLSANANVQDLDPDADAEQIEELRKVANELPGLLEQIPKACITLPTFETDLLPDAG